MSFAYNAQPIDYKENISSNNTNNANSGSNTNTSNNTIGSSNTNSIPKRNVTFKNRHEGSKPKIKKEMIEDLDVYQSDDNDHKPVQNQFKEPESQVSGTDAPIKTKEGFAKIDSTYASDYYKQFSPYQGTYQIPQPSISGNTELLTKLDNILHLLEDQQEEKTNLITEELILYVFLGVFVIYVLDSFVKVGKYTR